jgi:hypothetical protein
VFLPHRVPRRYLHAVVGRAAARTAFLAIERAFPPANTSICASRYRMRCANPQCAVAKCAKRCPGWRMQALEPNRTLRMQTWLASILVFRWVHEGSCPCVMLSRLRSWFLCAPRRHAVLIRRTPAATRTAARLEERAGGCVSRGVEDDLRNAQAALCSAVERATTPVRDGSCRCRLVGKCLRTGARGLAVDGVVARHADDLARRARLLLEQRGPGVARSEALGETPRRASRCSARIPPRWVSLRARPPWEHRGGQRYASHGRARH